MIWRDPVALVFLGLLISWVAVMLWRMVDLIIEEVDRSSDEGSRVSAGPIPRAGRSGPPRAPEDSR